jgi:hypothetical protein
MSIISSSTTTTTAYKVTADTTGTLVLQTGSTPTTAVTVGTDQSVTFAQSANLPNTFGFKNRIINGAMVIDQRNAGAAVTANAAFVTDRFFLDLSQASKISFQQSSTAPAGFINSLAATSSSAYSIGSGDYFQFTQNIEGLNMADFAWGTASAAAVTLSFWVRSSLTGTFGGALRNNALNRSYPFTYTINAANTFEYKTITIAGDQSGTWLTTNGIGIRLTFGLGNGSTYSGASGSWASANYQNATGATSLVGTNGATFYITGVQLEKGSTATSFDYRPYGTELQLCQRYYYKNQSTGVNRPVSSGGQCYASSGAIVFCPFPVPMRTNPTALEQSGTTTDYGVWNSGSSNVSLSSVPTFNNASYLMAYVDCQVASGLTAGNATALILRNTNSYLAWSAEL